MLPSEDVSPPPTGRAHRAHRDVALPPLAWVLVTGGVLFLSGIIISSMNHYSTATWSMQKVGFLLGALGFFTSTAIPGALMALGHRWAAAILRYQKQNDTYPRLLGLTLAWVGILFSGWFIAVAFLSPYYSLARDTYLVFLVGIGPAVALLLFDRRR
jgi:hypothetical protein